MPLSPSLVLAATVFRNDGPYAVTAGVPYVRSVFGVGPRGITKINRSSCKCCGFHLLDKWIWYLLGPLYRSGSGQCVGSRRFDWSPFRLPPLETAAFAETSGDLHSSTRPDSWPPSWYLVVCLLRFFLLDIYTWWNISRICPLFVEESDFEYNDGVTDVA